MKEEKISFIENELTALVRVIDNKIKELVPVANSDETDIIAVTIVYNLGRINVNVECDSLLAIAKDVIKRI